MNKKDFIDYEPINDNRKLKKQLKIKTMTQ